MEPKDFSGQSNLSNDDILKIATDFVHSNPKLPKDRILLFEYGMRTFRDKFFEPLLHQRDLLNKTVCDNITKRADETVIRCNKDRYAWEKREQELLKQIENLTLNLQNQNKP